MHLVEVVAVRRTASLRWIVLVVVLVLAAMGATWWSVSPGPARPPLFDRPPRPTATAASVDLAQAVRRTVAAGSASFDGTYTPAGAAGGGRAVALSGAASFVTPHAVVRVASDEPALVAEVRTTPAGAWVRAGPSGAWSPIDPGVVTTAATARGWGDLLGGLAEVPGGGAAEARAATRILRAAHGADPVTVEVDGAGRIVRLLLEQPAGTLDVRFHDFGVPVAIDPPPPP